MVRPMRREVLVTFTAMLVVVVASQAAYREILVTDGGNINDPFLHDAHAWLGPQTLFNLAIPRDRTVDFELHAVAPEEH
jgi:hypothetical protein